MLADRCGFALACRLALLDLWHDRVVTSCSVIGLAAVLTPLLILFGLRFGVVEGMLRNLESDPRSREMRPLLHGGYDADWLRQLAARPETGFVIANTRFLSSQVELRTADDRSALVDLLPTDAGDPVVTSGASIAARPDSFALSSAVAAKLHVTLSQPLQVVVTRRRNVGGLQEAVLALRVAEILPPAAVDRDSAFVSLGLLQQIEDYREGGGELAAPTGTSLEGRRFATFRLYARSIYEVAALRKVLLGLGIDTASMLSAIELVTRLDRGVTSLFTLIAVIGCGGYLVVLAMSIWSSTEWRRGQIATLRLIGFRAAALATFPLIQGVVTGILGGLLSIGLFLAIRPAVNTLFKGQLTDASSACHLLAAHFAIALCGTVLLSAAAACMAVMRVLRVSPAESLRLA